MALFVSQGGLLMTIFHLVRLKARARDLDAADEKDMASILAAGT